MKDPIANAFSDKWMNFAVDLGARLAEGIPLPSELSCFANGSQLKSFMQCRAAYTVITCVELCAPGSPCVTSSALVYTCLAALLRSDATALFNTVFEMDFLLPSMDIWVKAWSGFFDELHALELITPSGHGELVNCKRAVESVVKKLQLVTARCSSDTSSAAATSPSIDPDSPANTFQTVYSVEDLYSFTKPLSEEALEMARNDAEAEVQDILEV